MATIKILAMLSNLKAKFSSLAQEVSTNENAINRKIEIISANLKSMPSIVARDLKIEGNLNSEGLVEVEGHIKGIVNCAHLIIREEGFVEGKIIAESLSIRGKFDGEISAKNINISAKADIKGVIEYEFLCVEDGASIDGQFKQKK